MKINRMVILLVLFVMLLILYVTVGKMYKIPLIGCPGKQIYNQNNQMTEKDYDLPENQDK